MKLIISVNEYALFIFFIQAFHWWKEGHLSWTRYPSTLYITAGRVTPPTVPLTPTLRSRVVLQNEQGSAASIASTSALQTDVDENDSKDDDNINNNDDIEAGSARVSNM